MMLLQTCTPQFLNVQASTAIGQPPSLRMSRGDTTNCALQWQANGRIEARHRVINRLNTTALAEHVVQPPSDAASRWLRVESEKPPLHPDSERDVCPGSAPRKILPRAVAGAAAIAAQRATGAVYIFRSAAHGAPRLGIINAPQRSCGQQQFAGPE